jgi:membrane-associated protease RseP (regulator of RpoE activity)
MFGIRVRVHPGFWLIACLFGAGYLEDPRYGAGYLLVWVVCMFVSILFHELGHVVMGRVFGAPGDIVLYTFGGLAVGSSNLGRRWQRVAVLFAGPLAGLLLFAAVYAVQLHYCGRLYFASPGGDAPPRAESLGGLTWAPWDMSPVLWILLHATDMLAFMNLFWNILNLFPIYPLDGGQITRELFSAASPRNGFRIALVVSLALAALLAVHSLMAVYHRPLIPFLPTGTMYSAMLFGLMALENLMMLQQLSAAPRPRRQWDDEDDGWRR